MHGVWGNRQASSMSGCLIVELKLDVKLCIVGKTTMFTRRRIYPSSSSRTRAKVRHLVLKPTLGQHFGAVESST